MRREGGCASRCRPPAPPRPLCVTGDHPVEWGPTQDAPWAAEAASSEHLQQLRCVPSQIHSSTVHCVSVLGSPGSPVLLLSTAAACGLHAAPPSRHLRAGALALGSGACVVSQVLRLAWGLCGSRSQCPAALKSLSASAHYFGWERFSSVCSGHWPPHSFCSQSLLYHFGLNTGGGFQVFSCTGRLLSLFVLISLSIDYSLYEANVDSRCALTDPEEDCPPCFLETKLSLHPACWAPSAWAAHQLSAPLVPMRHTFSHLLLVRPRCLDPVPGPSHCASIHLGPPSTLVSTVGSHFISQYVFCLPQVHLSLNHGQVSHIVKAKPESGKQLVLCDMKFCSSAKTHRTRHFPAFHPHLCPAHEEPCPL